MIEVAVSGVAAEAVATHIPRLVDVRFASRLANGDATLWGTAAEPEASIRLGWFHASRFSRPLVEEIYSRRDDFRARGLTRIVLSGMGGSSLAPEVISRTAGVELVVLDSTHPTQVTRVVDTDIDRTVVVVSSKSGSTAETDSHKRAFEEAFTKAGIDPLSRIVVVTDPGSPLDVSARDAGYRVLNADPNVGGRYSALTAFGLVPTGLAGVDIGSLLDEADSVLESLAADTMSNPGLVLGAAIAGTIPRRDKLAVISTESSIVGIGDWIEQLVAESTGKEETGVLPVVLEPGARDLSAFDMLPVYVTDAPREAQRDSVVISGALGAQLIVWEVATAVAGHILGINPFDQPDVESAKVAARALLDGTPEPAVPFAVDGEVTLSALGYVPTATTVTSAVRELIALLADDGYLAIHAYADREAGTRLELVRDALATASHGRPTTFGWGPRFLHSTGQYHKGGPKQGVYLQIVDHAERDRAVPGRPYTFGGLMAAQARGDATVLSQHGRPVLTLALSGQRAAMELATALRTIEASA